MLIYLNVSTSDLIFISVKELGIETFPQFYVGKNVITDNTGRFEYSGIVSFININMILILK